MIIIRPIGAFTLDRVLDYPFPDNLVAAPKGATIAWTFSEHGGRNIYVADGPEFQARRLTPYVGNDYAANQYLASRGFIVLSVNYPRTQLGHLRGGRGHSRRAQLGSPGARGAEPERGARGRRHHAGGSGKGRVRDVRVVTGLVGGDLEVAGAAHPRRRRP